VSDYQRIMYAVAEGVATVTLNRPEKRNALDDVTLVELRAVLRRVSDDDSVKVLLLTGAGADFCSGADLASLQAMASRSVLENRDDARGMMELFLDMRRLTKPTVAAVRGRALAGGCGLATACDIVLASRGARFGYPEVRIGFIPAMVMAILRRSVAEKLAFELIVRGEQITAERAAEIGMVNRVFDDETFDSDVRDYLAGFASLSTSAVVLAKYLLYHIDGLPFEAAVAAGADLNAIARMTEDCQRGVQRFLTK
jgi:methylglutaconyl-CoA hydratase